MLTMIEREFEKKGVKRKKVEKKSTKERVSLRRNLTSECCTCYQVNALILTLFHRSAVMNQTQIFDALQGGKA
jgi:hypothetical protein